jgi:hypothetical protein
MSDFINNCQDLSIIPAKIVPYNLQNHGNRLFQGIPGIEYNPMDSSFYATWYGGGADEGPGNYAMLALSKDGGDSWSEVISVACVDMPVRVYDPGLWCSPEGVFYWYWNQSYDKFDGRAGVWIARTLEKNSPFPPWEIPRRIGNGVMMNKPTVMAKDGIWCFPAAIWNLDNMVTSYPISYPEDYQKERYSNLLISLDRGKNFTLCAGPDIPERSFDEHMIVEKNNGAWELFVRTFYGIGAKVSSDQGRTWQHYHNNYSHHNVYRKGPSTRFFIRRLRSGRWLLVYHDHPGIRCRLSAWLSEDEGQTWPWQLLLDERINVSYPDGTETNDGFIRIIYDRERYRDMEILMARFTEEDVLGGSIRDSQSRLKIMINKGSL